MCPACRKEYSETPADFTALSSAEVARIKQEKRQKKAEKRRQDEEMRRHLANVRVVQKNLVYVIGLPNRVTNNEALLRRNDFFGKFGKILKVVINKNNHYNSGPNPTVSAYITFAKKEDATHCVRTIDKSTIDGRTLRASLGTTKYCSNFLRNQACPNPDCMYLHELGDEASSYTKQDMLEGKHASNVVPDASNASRSSSGSNHDRDRSRATPVAIPVTGRTNSGPSSWGEPVSGSGSWGTSGSAGGSGAAPARHKSAAARDTTSFPKPTDACDPSSSQGQTKMSFEPPSLPTPVPMVLPSSSSTAATESGAIKSIQNAKQGKAAVPTETSANRDQPPQSPKTALPSSSSSSLQYHSLDHQQSAKQLPTIESIRSGVESAPISGYTPIPPSMNPPIEPDSQFLSAPQNGAAMGIPQPGIVGMGGVGLGMSASASTSNSPFDWQTPMSGQQLLAQLQSSALGLPPFPSGGADFVAPKIQTKEESDIDFDPWVEMSRGLAHDLMSETNLLVSETAKSLQAPPPTLISSQLPLAGAQGSASIASRNDSFGGSIMNGNENEFSAPPLQATSRFAFARQEPETSQPAGSSIPAQQFQEQMRNLFPNVNINFTAANSSSTQPDNSLSAPSAVDLASQPRKKSPTLTTTMPQSAKQKMTVLGPGLRLSGGRGRGYAGARGRGSSALAGRASGGSRGSGRTGTVGRGGRGTGGRGSGSNPHNIGHMGPPGHGGHKPFSVSGHRQAPNPSMKGPEVGSAGKGFKGPPPFGYPEPPTASLQNMHFGPGRGNWRNGSGRSQGGRSGNSWHGGS